MIPPPMIRNIMERLLNKSRLREVNWREGDSSRPSGEAEYTIILPPYRITISRELSSALDKIIIKFDLDLRLICQVEFEEGEEGWDLALALYTEAETMVRGLDLDRILGDLERAIDTPGTIGLRG